MQLTIWQKNRGLILEMTSPAPCVLPRRNAGTALRRSASTRRMSYMLIWQNSYWLRRKGEAEKHGCEIFSMNGMFAWWSRDEVTNNWDGFGMLVKYYLLTMLVTFSLTQRTRRIQGKTGRQSKWRRCCQDFIKTRTFYTSFGLTGCQTFNNICK